MNSEETKRQVFKNAERIAVIENDMGHIKKGLDKIDTSLEELHVCVHSQRSFFAGVMAATSVFWALAAAVLQWWFS